MEPPSSSDGGGDNDDGRARFLCLSREEIDNPHKEKTWGVFTEDFKVGVRMRTTEAPAEDGKETREQQC